MHNNIKIAIIEDDENLRFLIVHRLESCNTKSYKQPMEMMVKD